MGDAVTEPAEPIGRPPAAAIELFGDRLPIAVDFVELLAREGERRGLIGPREVPRLWERHVLNSAVMAELVPQGARLIDVGSGAGFPGVPLAIARPDLRMTLLDPMERRTTWLTEVVSKLGLDVSVMRGRAEEPTVRRSVTGVDVASARAVAPLAKLARWCLPLLRPGGLLLALKGASAAEELDRDADAVRASGGTDLSVVTCGAELLAVPTTAVVIRKESSARSRDGRRRTGKDH